MQNLCRLSTNFHTHAHIYIYIHTHIQNTTVPYMKHHQSCKLLQNAKLQRTCCFPKTPSPSNVFPKIHEPEKNPSFGKGRTRFTTFFVSNPFAIHLINIVVRSDLTDLDHIRAAWHLRFRPLKKEPVWIYTERPPPRQSP